MIIRADRQTVMVFDLDDTLYQEYDYARSAFREIANKMDHNSDTLVSEMMTNLKLGKNVYFELKKKYGSKVMGLDFFLELYRNHTPDISLDNETRAFLHKVKQSEIVTGLITEGRSYTQRNKLASLGLKNYFDKVIITEELGTSKTDEKNFRYFHLEYPEHRYYYIADNPQKDFITPNHLGWITIMKKDDGKNLYKQDIIQLPDDFHPNIIINNFNEIDIQCLGKRDD